MEKLQTKTEIRETILTANEIEMDGKNWTRTLSQAGFIKESEKKFMFVNDLFKQIYKNNYEVKKDGQKLIIN